MGRKDRANRDERRRETFAGKIVLITGSSRGIGAEAARQVARAGATVLLVARDREALGQVRDEIEAEGGRARIYPTDLADLDAVGELAQAVLRDHGGVDVLIHNAARSIRRPLSRSIDRFHDFERTIGLNYLSPVRLTLALLPSLRARRASVCLVLTLGVLIPGPYFAAYLASKAALATFGDALAAELRHEGVHVSSIYLPLVRTEMMAPTKEYSERSDVMTPRRAAAWVLDSVVDRKRRVIPPVGYWYGTSNLWRPRSVTRVLNVLERTFPADGSKSEFPRFEALVRRTLGGSPI